VARETLEAARFGFDLIETPTTTRWARSVKLRRALPAADVRRVVADEVLARVSVHPIQSC